MAQAALRPCAEPGCGQLVQQGRCDAHRKDHDRQRQRTSTQRGYDYAWQQLRISKLTVNPCCEIAYCKGDRPMPNLATEVNHIQPIIDRPDLRLVWANLESACEPCHRRRDAERRKSFRM